MPPKRFEGKFGIPSSHAIDSQLTSALYRLPESVGLEYINNLTKEIVDRVNQRLETDADEHSPRSLDQNEIQTLTLKFARHFEDNGESAKIDVPTCIDALIESPKFLNSDKGSMEKLFELHEMKTLQKIAELRRKRAEITDRGEGESNPYENLFETTSGKYYLVRLLNMPHLEEESIYMHHCVGTSTSYVNRMKRGEVEILSFRDTATNNPLVTIEYDCKKHRLLQVKAVSDRIPTLADDFAPDLIEALERIGDTINDLNEKREVKSKEVEHLKTLLVLKEKMRSKEEFTKDELLFLYEAHTRIQCFDNEQEDPLVNELRSERDRKKDIQIMWDCTPEYVVTDFIHLQEDTQVFCEDTGTRVIICDFREEKNKVKLPQLIELAKNLKESGSSAQPDVSLEGGIVHVDLEPEMLRDISTALQSFEDADNHSPSSIQPEFRSIQPFIPLESTQFDIIVLSYNKDKDTRKMSDEIVEDMERAGLRPATVGELIALGIAYPDFNQGRVFLVGLGTQVPSQDGTLVPTIGGDATERCLLMAGWASDWWDGRDRYICVRK